MLQPWEVGLWASVVSLGVAIYFTWRLTRETRGEKYWSWLLVAVVLMAVHHFVEVPWAYGLISLETHLAIEKATEIPAALSLAYASYGLYASMRRIRERLRDA